MSATRWASSSPNCAANSTPPCRTCRPISPFFLPGTDRKRVGRVGISGRSVQPRRPFQRRTGRRGHLSAHDAHRVHPGATSGLSHARIARSTLRQGLRCGEDWPYIPHLTILKAETDELARAACAVARERWQSFPATRGACRGTCVRPREWRQLQDLARLALGHGQLSSKV